MIMHQSSVALTIFLFIKMLSADLPQCLLNNMMDVQCNVSPTNYFFFSNEFYLKFNLIYIGRDNSSENFDIVGCSCDRNECDLWCCPEDTLVINFNKCFHSELGIRNLSISGDTVDIFEHSFGWPKYNESWKLCDKSHPFLVNIAR